MKQFVLLFAISLFHFSLFAQTAGNDSSNSSTHTVTKLKPPKDQPFFYYIYFKGGKMIMGDGNKETPITKPMITDNGSTVNPDGTILTNFGNTKKFTKDGEAINKSGKFTYMRIIDKPAGTDSSKQH